MRENFEAFENLRGRDADPPLAVYLHNLSKQQTWAGTDELFALATLLGVDIWVYPTMYKRWVCHSPLQHVPSNTAQQLDEAIYIKNSGNEHFEPVTAVEVRNEKLL